MNPFKLVCFCVLMDHHRAGVEQAHPDYLIEKFATISICDDREAYSMLDAHNQARVGQWCETWGIPLPL